MVSLKLLSDSIALVGVEQIKKAKALVEIEDIAKEVFAVFYQL